MMFGVGESTGHSNGGYAHRVATYDGTTPSFERPR